MVMNKKEQALVDNLLKENEALKLQISGQSLTEPPDPFVWDFASWKAQGQKVVEGWAFNAVLSWHNPYWVYPVWSKGVVHYHNSEMKHGIQGAGVLYRTKREALLAARAELQKDWNQLLASINKDIGGLQD